MRPPNLPGIAILMRSPWGSVGVGADPERGRGLDRLPGEAACVHPRLPGTSASGPVDREHSGGEVQRLGGVGSLQAPRDELVAAGGAGAGGAGGGAAQWGVGPLASGRRTPRANAARADREGRLSSKTGAPTGER